jgi:hypothetical protein
MLARPVLGKESVERIITDDWLIRWHLPVRLDRMLNW